MAHFADDIEELEIRAIADHMRFIDDVLKCIKDAMYEFAELSKDFDIIGDDLDEGLYGRHGVCCLL